MGLEYCGNGVSVCVCVCIPHGPALCPSSVTPSIQMALSLLRQMASRISQRFTCKKKKKNFSLFDGWIHRLFSSIIFCVSLVAVVRDTFSESYLLSFANPFKVFHCLIVLM